MATSASTSTMQKVTVTLPKKLLERLDEVVPPRQRSRFVAEAIQEQLAILEQVAALDEAAGVWKDENHPEMISEADIDRWLDQLRGSWGSMDTPNE